MLAAVYAFTNQTVYKKKKKYTDFYVTHCDRNITFYLFVLRVCLRRKIYNVIVLNFERSTAYNEHIKRAQAEGLMYIIYIEFED